MRRYVNIPVEVDVSDFMEEVDDETLMEYVKDRGLMRRNTFSITPVENYKPGDFRRILCDMLTLGYQASDEQIIERIKECI